ncbi:MAG: hypothetical protein GXN99_00070, partial [Candidatus Nanohaloarchaeota archaeon]|nr:hypothetical protein [Candidatus Nanohaloarchaeota archaeon]
MVNNKRKLLGIVIIVSFTLFVISLMYYIDYIRIQRESGRITVEMIENMTKEELIQYIEERRSSYKDLFYFYRLIPIISFSGIAIGALVYYLLEEKVSNKSKQLKNNTQIILKLLSPGERKVIEALLEKNGKAMQFEFNRIPGFN